ncbi:autophagy-related protein 6 [Ophiocordyceps camponoti-floridani]|uniref:Autophagy-related protein 6 n=1 Tax=Ophiocordyceps camponoti-floridani TaxID=2030778 RepID=A0A8H4VFB1_9HYPO|nr:autophagy-related protein 6 [Ophiocordyceps camponoti-floridani]
MGWLSSIFSSSSSTDALDKLDPKVRAFLEKESPVRYAPSQPPATKPEHEAGKPETGKPTVPTASLYQDGRYAHLWKNYRPLAETEAENATDGDRLSAVLEGYKSRKAALASAALENCSLEQEEWVNCMKDGSWEDRMQMCRHQVRRFERCYMMQSRFLRIIGYGSVANRPAAMEEAIQMQADALYQRMLKHEAAVSQAKKDGTPIPTFDLIIPNAPPSSVSTQGPTPADEQAWQRKLDDLPEDERAIEVAALRADYQAKAEVASSVMQIRQTQREGRDERLAQGKASVLDSLSAFLWRGK